MYDRTISFSPIQTAITIFLHCLFHSSTNLYCIERVSLLLFSSSSYIFFLFFSPSLVFFPLEPTCCLIYGLFSPTASDKRTKKTSACLLLVTTSSVQNTPDNTNNSFEKEKLKEFFSLFVCLLPY
jgi:hypothetical protein